MSKVSTSALKDNQTGLEASVISLVHGPAKAWVSWRIVGGFSLRSSYNVSSVTYNGVGNYTVNFTTPMVDSNYCTLASTQAGGVNNITVIPLSPSSVQIAYSFLSGSSVIAGEVTHLNVAVYR